MRQMILLLVIFVVMISACQTTRSRNIALAESSPQKKWYDAKSGTTYQVETKNDVYFLQKWGDGEQGVIKVKMLINSKQLSKEKYGEAVYFLNNIEKIEANSHNMSAIEQKAKIDVHRLALDGLLD